MKSNLFIPKKLKIGFNNRADTYTGKLGYVIFQDERGIWHKEKSWEGWIDKEIDVLEIDNDPTEGFVLNKGLQRVSYHWGSGRSVIRVYDPRDFEFEINVDNLLGILTHSDVSKRGIVEKMVFAWGGKDLVLLPINSEAYEESVKFTNLQDKKLSAKSLVPGKRYMNKKNGTEYVYIGHYNFWKIEKEYVWKIDGDYEMNKSFHINTRKKHIFCDLIKKNYDSEEIVYHFSHPSVSTLCEIESSDIDPRFAEMSESFFSTIHSQPIVGIAFEDYVAMPKHVEYWDNRRYEPSYPVYIKESENSWYRPQFKTDGHDYLAYEIHVANFDSGSLTINHINSFRRYKPYKVFLFKQGDVVQKLKYVLENGKETYVD
jgi:hypothetical protein